MDVSVTNWHIQAVGYGLTFRVELNTPATELPSVAAVADAFGELLSRGWRAQFLAWDNEADTWKQRDTPTSEGWQGGCNIGTFTIRLRVAEGTQCTPAEGHKVLRKLEDALAHD